MAEEVLRRLVERGNRDRQRQTDQAQSIKATQYIGNGYVQQIGQAPTRSRYLGNAGLVPGELVAPLGHGQQDVITHKKPVAFTASSQPQPQETIAIIPGNTIEIIYDSWTDKPADWLQLYYAGENNRIVGSAYGIAYDTNVPSETYTYTQTITIPFSGQARIAATGVIDFGYITFNGHTLNFEYPGTGVFSDYATIEPGEYPLFVSVTDTIPGGPGDTIPEGPGIGFRIEDISDIIPGIGFRIEYIPDIIYISEE